MAHRMMRVPLGACLLTCAGLVALAALAPARAQDTANSSATFWVEEAARQRARAAPPQRVRRLMPRREFARPTYWNDRPVAARAPASVPSAPVATLPVSREGAPPGDAADTTPRGDIAGLPPAAAPGSEPPAAAAPAVPATPARKFTIGVVGDSLAYWLALGLADSFPASQGVTIISKARDSSGLVRDDFFDWPKALREFVNATTMDVLVVMVGSNDRQPLRGTSGFEEPLSKGWEAIYSKRVETIAAIAADKKIPVLWVGLPIMKNERYTLDMAALNDIYKARIGASGAHFVDVFDAFSDEKGQYSAFGPDVNGTIVKLRATDGVHFTMPGARKLAHFLEGDIRKLREPTKQAAPEPSLETAALPVTTRPEAGVEASPKSAVVVVPAVPERPAIGPVVPLTAAPLAPRGELLGAPARLTDAQRAAFETQADRVFRDGGGSRAR